ncbi:MAG TPA: Spy/CpxP family protein refolding chaperone [Caulobacteraceae bacterium]|nr:Spy/CpxP family protein refolding chaperone [Caulobacteraceae bacterium]
MKSPLSRVALVAGAALSVSFAGATFAQTAPNAAPAPAVKPQHDPAAHAERLRTTLQLTAAQEPALQAFIASHQQQRAARQDRRAERQAMQALTTPQRLDRQAARMAERQQAFARRADAVKRFYAQLTPAQQKAFDAMHQGKGKRGKGAKARAGHQGH